MTYIQIQKQGEKIWAYLVQEYTDAFGSRKRKYLRRATEEELETHKKSIEAKNKLVPVVCTNPDCNRIFKIPQKQKQKFFTTFPLRYGRFSQPYCSKKCMEEHFKVLTSKRKSAEKQVLTSS